MKQFLNHPWFFWSILALPSIPMTVALSLGNDPESLLHPTGEFSARLMIIALMLTPLSLICRQMNWRTGWIQWLLKRRRALGVAAFGYALLHTIAYVLDVRDLQDMLAEFWSLGIWTGWAAFTIFVPMALTSNRASVVAMGARWKTLQRGVYLAAVLTLIHWVFVHNNPGPALANFIPLALLEAYRVFYFFNQRKHQLDTANT